MKPKMLLILFISFAVLSACSAEAEESATDLLSKENTIEETVYSLFGDDSPEGVVSGSFSEENYMTIKQFLGENAEYAKIEKFYNSRVEEFSSKDLYWEKELREEYSEFLQEYISFLSSIQLAKTTDEEFKFLTYLNNYTDNKTYELLSMKEYLDFSNENDLEGHYVDGGNTALAIDNLSDQLREYNLTQTQN